MSKLDFIPYYDEYEDVWKCEFPDRHIKEEEGCLLYIVSEFTGVGLLYHYYINGELNHTHGFEGILEEILCNYNSFSIQGFEYEYSEQELRMINELLEKLKGR